MTETIKIVGDNITLDLILWRKHGLRGMALIEEAMKLNPKLTGVYVPVGTDVVFARPSSGNRPGPRSRNLVRVI